MQADMAICIECKLKHKNQFIGWTCDAFPLGIPDAIVLMEHDHRRPFEGDDGVTFEPIDGSEVSKDPDEPIPWLDNTVTEEVGGE